MQILSSIMLFPKYSHLSTYDDDDDDVKDSRKGRRHAAAADD